MGLSTDHAAGETKARVLETMNDAYIRVGVLGNVDAGKTTLIGTLVSSTLDNGKGSSRSKIMKHKHEKETGRTSTISHHHIGFDADGTVLSNTNNCSVGDAELARSSSRMVSLMDLAGHEKYFKTTVSGLSMGMVDYALVLVNSAQAPTHMTMHHLRLCNACGIPVIIVMTKSDSCPSQVYQHTKKKLIEKLRSSDSGGKRQYAIKSEKDVTTVKDKLHSLIPLVTISSVTGEGLDLMRKLLFELPKRRQHQKKLGRPFEFLMEDVFNIKGVGTVVSGFVNSGEYKKGEPLFVGPLSNGSYLRATVRSIHVARTDVDKVYAGHSACFALSSLSKSQRSNLSRGMVGLKAVPNPATVQFFKAELCMLRGEPVTVTRGKYKATAHILHLKKVAKVIGIDCSKSTNGFFTGNDSSLVLRPGDQALVSFRLMGDPAYLRKGMRIILRDGHVRAIGVITDTAS